VTNSGVLETMQVLDLFTYIASRAKAGDDSGESKKLVRSYSLLI
jgi:hypothetical protein